MALTPVGDAAPKAFRGDIQGLRAIAVLLVALDHAAVGPFHGGFVGVDVFFVISGYLITSLLVAEVSRNGRISLVAFYSRRARRILPAATLVTLVTVAASVYFLSGIEALSATEDAVWATFFAANFKFASDGTDYFNAEAPPSPLQHYWSLAVEEQFYLAWPLLILLLCLLVRWGASRAGTHVSSGTPPRRRASTSAPPRVTHALVVLLVAIILASFWWSVVHTRGDPITAYFSPFTRAWELGVGALAACLVPWLSRTSRMALGVLSWVGLAGVLGAALVFDPGTPFPGYAAALPVGGAALLLIGGLNAPGWGPQSLLRLGPMRHIGDWSYSFYLWHWPMVVIADAVWGPISGWSGAAVLTAALALSGPTYVFVENPFRRMRMLSLRPARGLVLYPAILVLVLPLLVGARIAVERTAEGGGDWISTSNYGQQAGDPKPTFSKAPAVALVQASVLAAENDMEIPRGLEPSPLSLDDPRGDVTDCDYWNNFVDQLCPRGDTSGDRNLVVVGDSHARQWIPPIDALAKKYGYTAYYLVRQGCPGADVTSWLMAGGPAIDCEEFQDWAVEQVAELQPAVTIIGSETSSNRGYVDDAGELITDDDATARMFQDGMERSVQRLAGNSGRVILLGDPPANNFQVGICLSRRTASLKSCMADRDPRSLQLIAAARAGALKGGAEYVDPTPWFCERNRCPAVIGHYVPRRDLAHVTVAYALHLIPALDRQLDLGRGSGPGSRLDTSRGAADDG